MDRQSMVTTREGKKRKTDSAQQGGASAISHQRNGPPAKHSYRSTRNDDKAAFVKDVRKLKIEKGLKDLFSQHGTIKNIEIRTTSKVTMSTKDECRDAIFYLKNSKQDGNVIHVERYDHSRSKFDSVRSGKYDYTKAFVRDMEKSKIRGTLQKLFSNYGTPEEIEVETYAWVTMSSKEECMAAIKWLHENNTFEGETIHVEQNRLTT